MDEPVWGPLTGSRTYFEFTDGTGMTIDSTVPKGDMEEDLDVYLEEGSEANWLSLRDMYGDLRYLRIDTIDSITVSARVLVSDEVKKAKRPKKKSAPVDKTIPLKKTRPLPVKKDRTDG